MVCWNNCWWKLMRCREIMHAMYKPSKFKYVFLFATLYVFTLTIPSAIAVYWAFGDTLLTHSNSLSLLPKNAARDIAVILMLIHQVQYIKLLVESILTYILLVQILQVLRSIPKDALLFLDWNEWCNEISGWMVWWDGWHEWYHYEMKWYEWSVHGIMMRWVV